MAKQTHLLLPAALAIVMAALSSPTGADVLSDPPQGPVLLTVNGAIGLRNMGDVAALDRAQLEALDATSFSTSTIWTDGVDEYMGVPLLHLLESLGAEGDTIRATAANAYSIEIPIASLEENAPIIAYRINGEPFPLRRNGPLWVIYPYDSADHYRSEVIYGRSIWQLVSLTVSVSD
jgi:hypothetical protein